VDKNKHLRNLQVTHFDRTAPFT